jgi:hypothetical protein
LYWSLLLWGGGFCDVLRKSLLYEKEGLPALLAAQGGQAA